MKAFILPLLLAITLGSVATLRAQLFFDDFTTVNTTSTWNSVIASSGLGSITTTSGILSEKVGSTSSPYRTYLESQSSAFNPFAQALSFDFAGLTLSGTPSSTGSIAFYSIVGLAGTDTSTNYWPGSGSGGDYLVLEVVETTGSVYQLKILDYNGTTPSTTTYALEGAPTDIDWTIDGTGTNKSYSLSLSGTTFTTSGLSTTSGTFTNFNLAGLGTTPASRLVIGAVNLTGTETAAATVGLDSVTVTAAVPEPGTWLLLLLGGAGLLFVLRRRAGAVLARA